MYTSRSSFSSDTDNRKQSKVLQKKHHESNSNADRVRSPPDDGRARQIDRRGGPGMRYCRSTEHQHLMYFVEKQVRHYPDMTDILAVDSTHLLYDVRKRPKESIPEEIYERHKDTLATRRPTMHMRVISEYFPWTIDIKVTSQDIYGVRVRDVWKNLYTELQKPIGDSEWAILGLQNLVSPDKRESILRAAQRRGDNTKTPRRIDWLGSRTKFCGLYKDEKTDERLLLPSASACPDTWVANFSNHI